MLLTDAEQAQVDSGEVKAEDIPSTLGMSDAYVLEKVAEYCEFITTQHELVPRQMEVFRDIAGTEHVYEFLKLEKSAMISMSMHDALVITTALQRFMDGGKYLVADAELNGFEMDDAYKRGTILDNIVAEHWYNLILNMVEETKDEFMNSEKTTEVTE